MLQYTIVQCLTWKNQILQWVVELNQMQKSDSKQTFIDTRLGWIGRTGEATGIPAPMMADMGCWLHFTEQQQLSERIAEGAKLSVSHESSREMSRLLWLLCTFLPFSLELKQIFCISINIYLCIFITSVPLKAKFLPQYISHTCDSSFTVRKSAGHQAELLLSKAVEQIPRNQLLCTTKPDFSSCRGPVCLRCSCVSSCCRVDQTLGWATSGLTAARWILPLDRLQETLQRSSFRLLQLQLLLIPPQKTPKNIERWLRNQSLPCLKPEFVFLWNH